MIDIKFFLLACFSVLLLAGLSGCGDDPASIRNKASANAIVYADRAGLKVIDCSGIDSDGNQYVSCTFQNSAGENVVAECGYADAGIGCKAKQ